MGITFDKHLPALLALVLLLIGFVVFAPGALAFNEIDATPKFDESVGKSDGFSEVVVESESIYINGRRMQQGLELHWENERYYLPILEVVTQLGGIAKRDGNTASWTLNDVKATFDGNGQMLVNGVVSGSYLYVDGIYWIPECEALKKAGVALYRSECMVNVVCTSATPAHITDNENVNELIAFAKTLIGVPYAYGGTSPSSGFDCSGYTSYVFKQFGIHLPRTAGEQMQLGEKVTYDELKPGDLLFFGGKDYIDHVGIYIGDSQYIHAPRPGYNVRIEDTTTSYFQSKYVGARRVPISE